MQQRKRQRGSNQPVPTSEQQKKLTRLIAQLGLILTVTPFMTGHYLYVHDDELTGFSRELLWWCTGVSMFTVFWRLGINIEVRELKGDIFADDTVHRKYRRCLVWIVALAIFSNLVLLIPILYMQGHITRWAAYLPAASIAKERLALTISFSVAAIISGVVGNFAYDVLRHLVQKSFTKNAAKEP
jgi:hypothetical protein